MCDQSFGNISEVEEHIRYDHIDEQCENFSEKGSEIEAPEQVIHISNPGNIVLTSECSDNSNHGQKQSGVISSQNEHFLNNSGNSSTKILCNICLLSFDYEVDLKQHNQKHTEDKRLPSILKSRVV